MTGWKCVYELDSARRPVAGKLSDLSNAVGNAADLRIGTAFRHNEHIDVRSSSPEPILEFAEFAITWRLRREWIAGIMSLRQPIQLPDRFGARPSMSFFLYNQDGTQGIARPYLDGLVAGGIPGPAELSPPPDMPRYHVIDAWDEGTNAPSHNFVYDFDGFRFCVNDAWQEVFSHSAAGDVTSGSLDELVAAFSDGCSIKVGVSGLRASADGTQGELHPDECELFVQSGSAYFYTEQRMMIVGTHPIVRVAPRIPLRYVSEQWDFGWLMVRSDGHVVYRRCDPCTLHFFDEPLRCAVRWFVR